MDLLLFLFHYSFGFPPGKDIKLVCSCTFTYWSVHPQSHPFGCRDCHKELFLNTTKYAAWHLEDAQ